MAEQEQPDNGDAALRALAAQADEAGADGDFVAEQAESAPAQEAQKGPEGSENLDGKTEVTPSQEQSQPAETQQEIDYRTEYERLRKEQERKDRSWQKLNEEKEALAKLRADTRVNETRISGDQFSAEEYEAYAEKVIEEGGPDAVKVARQAMTKAKEIKQKFMQESWQKSINEAIAEEPSLADQESDLAREVNKVLQGGDWGSFKAAVKLAKATQLANSLPGLKGEIENYKKEIERLNKAMEVGGKPGLPKREAPKRFEDMSTEEMRAHIRSRATEADENAY